MPASSEIRALTGLRGVAAMYVVLYHLIVFKLDLAGTLPAPLATLATHGYLAVDLFFVLSGFVMAMTYAAWFANGAARAPYADFLARRLARVWPLYAVLTLLTVGDRPPAQLCANLALVQSWGIADSIVGQGWSISTEWAAYLAFPLLLGATCRGSRRRTALCAAAAASLLAALAILPGSLSHAVRHSGPLDFYSGTNYAPLLRCLCEFSLGLAAWRLAGSGRRWSLADAPGRVDALALLTLALLLTPHADLAVALLFPLLVLGIAMQDGGIATQRAATSRLLGCGPACWLGRISYALYLVHGLDRLYRQQVMQGLAGLGPLAVPATALTLLAGNLALAVLAHHLVEKPGQRQLLRMWHASRQAHAATALPADRT